MATVQYKFEGPSDALRVVLDEPEDYIHSLQPEELSDDDDQLKEGNWLILLFAKWSAQDWVTAERVIRQAKRLDGRFKLGLIPCHDRTPALKAIQPERGPRTPIFIIIKDGEEVFRYTSTLFPDEIERLIEKYLLEGDETDQSE